MKKSKLLVSLLTSIIAVSSLTACNSGVGKPASSTTSSSVVKNLTVEELTDLYNKIKGITKKTTTKELLDIIEKVEDIQNEGGNPDIDKVHYNFATAILGSKFGTNPKVLKALAASLGNMSITDLDSQYYIGRSIPEGKFGKDPEVLKALAISLGNMSITDLDSQYYIGRSIPEGKFGKDPEVLKALATSLGNMSITSLEAQEEIACGIYGGKFGSDPEVLKTLATSLGNMNITGENAQYYTASSISAGRFGTDPEVLKALATSLSNMNITVGSAQYRIAMSISEGKFGKDPEVLKALATSLGSVKISFSEAYKELVEAIIDNRFGTDPEVLQALAISLGKMNITDPSDIKNIGEKYLQLNPNLAKYILSRWIISDEVIADAPEFAAYHFFGQLNPNIESHVNGSVNKNEIIESVSMVPLGIKDALEKLNVPKEGNLGSYGFIYNENGEPEALIILAENDSLGEQITGFLRITEDTRLIYNSLVYNVKVYKIEHRYGFMFVDRAQDVVSADQLPTWLNIAQSYAKFNSNNYQYADLIEFALSFPKKLTEFPTMSTLSISAIQRLIINQGSSANIDSDKSTDQELKDKINTAFEPLILSAFIEESSVLSDEINTFWNNLPDAYSKAKLIFLLGQIAKQGALGYHHGGKNQANMFYYLLTLKLAEKFKAELDPSSNTTLYESLGKLIFLLERGECIEEASHQFMMDNPLLSLNNVWMKKEGI